MARKLVPCTLLAALLGLTTLQRPGPGAWAQTEPQEIKVVAPRNYPHYSPTRGELCPGCDCQNGFCYSPICDCRLPITQQWATEMERQLVDRLEQNFTSKKLVMDAPSPPPSPPAPENSDPNAEETPAPPPVEAPAPEPRSLFLLKRLPTVAVTAPQYLVQFGSDKVQGYYGGGRISISSELSRRDAITVIAHELGHAWQAENNPQAEKVNPFLAEGFAEWMAYQALRCYGDGATAYKIQSSSDPVYGDGLRWFLDLENERGAPVVFNVARTWLDGKGNKAVAAPVFKPKAPAAAKDE